MTILQDLQIKIDFILNDKQLEDLEKTLHNVKAEALGLGHSHDAINKSLQRTANLYAIAILENEKKLNATNNLTQAEIANANALKQNNQALYEEIKSKFSSNEVAEKTYQVNQKVAESYKRYLELLKKGAKYSSFSEYQKQELIEEKKLQDQKNTSLVKQILLMKKQADEAAKTGNAVVSSQNSQLSAINKNNNALIKYGQNTNKSSMNINSFGDNLRNFSSQLLFVTPATMSFAFAIQGFGQLFKGLSNTAENSTNIVKKSIASLQSVIFGLGIAIAGAGGAVGYFALSNAKYAEDLVKNAEIIGMTADEYQRLAYAANLNGVNYQELESSLGSFFQVLKDSKDGKLTEQQEQFKKFGISLKDSFGNTRNLSSILSDVSDKFAKIESPIKRAAMASSLFGDSGRKLLPFLKYGSEELKALGDEAEKTGNVLSDAQINKLLELQANYGRLSGMLTGLKYVIGTTLAPFMNTLILRLTDWYEVSGMVLRQNLEGFFRNVSHGLSRFTQIMRNGYNIIKGFIKALDGMGISLNTLSIILLLFGSWKIFGLLGNILLGKGGGNLFSKIASKAKWFFGLLIGLITGAATFVTTLITVLGTSGLTGALIFLGDVIIGILAAIFSPAVLIGVAIAALFLLIQDFMTWVEGGDSLFRRMFGDWGNAKKKILEIIDNIKQWFKELWNNVCGFFIEKVINPIKTHGLIGILEAVANIQTTIFNLIKSGLFKLFEFIEYIIGKIWNGIVYLFKKIPDAINGLFKLLSKLGDFLKPYFQKFIDWLLFATWDGIKNIFNNIKDLFSNFWKETKKFIGIDQPFEETKGRTMFKTIWMEQLSNPQNSGASENNFKNNSLGMVPNIPYLNPSSRNETNNINYSITSPLSINVSSQSNPQEIANIVNRSLSDHWDSQMRAAKQNIYRG
ncbi:MAG: hypothetical protein K2X69_14205 [Silvanigrellaceae bacterium]|nr:hypothetical protein [Silvanigrellaceae bacterium]